MIHDDINSVHLAMARELGLAPDASSIDLAWRSLSATIWSHGDAELRPPPVDGHLVAIDLDGGVLVRCERRGEPALTVRRRRFDVCYVGPGLQADWIFRGPMRAACLVLSRDVVAEAIEDVAGTGRPRMEVDVFLGRTNPLVGPLCMTLAEAVGQRQPISRIFAESLGAMFASVIVKLATEQVPPRPARGGLTPRQQKHVTEYLTAHLSHDIGLDSLAAVAGLSKFHFLRCFRTSFGVSPFGMLEQLRLDEAQ